jgi:SAM-dependent methyltransferase
MSGRTHATHVEDQFGARARDYVTSAVHAQGADLEALGDLLRAAAPARLLDVGCGGGHVSYLAAPLAGAVTACDLSPRMLAAVAETARARGLANIATREAVAEALPFDAASFDCVVTRLSAHHWGDMRKGVAEMARVLAPGGLAVFIDTVSPGEAKLDTFLQAFELLRDTSHVRNYTEAEWRDACAAAGLAVTRATQRRLPIDFASWIARMNTPEGNAQAIRALQDAMPERVRRHFDVAADGSFAFDTLMLEAVRAG